ncbi:AMP-binding protein, partial [Mycobacterium simiae]
RGLPGLIEYATDLFDRPSVEAFAGYYLHILDVVTGNAALGVDTIEITTSCQRELLLAAHTSTGVPEGTIPELFAAQVARTPNAVAVLDDCCQLNYAELAARADRLAARLRTYGAQPESIIAVALPRGVRLITALLAVTQTGAAYLPIDPDYPSQRTDYMLVDAAPLLLITDAATAPGLPEADIQRLVIDQLDADDVREPAHRPAPVRPDPDNLAYLVYTSGSTGVPKAVAATHRDVVALASDSCWEKDHGRVLVHSSIAFDASTYEVWVPLLRGGCLVIDSCAGNEIAALTELVAAHHVTALFLTTALVDLVAEASTESFASVRQLWVGGEALTPAAAGKLRAAHPGVELINVYGPTETTTFATYFRCGAADFIAGTSVPIGGPLDSMR